MSTRRHTASGTNQELINTARDLHQKVVAWRRELHRNPELAFREFRTASFVLSHLRQLGYDVHYGHEAMGLGAVLRLPVDAIDQSYRAAGAADADSQFLSQMQGGLTAVIGELDLGPGPTVAFRFDMDALPIVEASDSDHRPAVDGFSSKRPGCMHACGHDGHTAMGLGLAAVLAKAAPHLSGHLRLIFQPAEEGAPGGAAAIVAKGWIDDVDYFVGCHLGLGVPTGKIYSRGYLLATSKYKVTIRGRNAHVANCPQTGRNALLASASAALALHSIPPHSEGWFSLNVGLLMAGEEQGVVPANATMELGFWADSEPVHDYVRDRVLEVLQGTASTWQVAIETELIGQAPTAAQDADLASIVREAARSVPDVHDIEDELECRGADDANVFIKRVTETGGKAIYMLVGSQLADGHHNPKFDFDETSLFIGTAVLSCTAGLLLGSSTRLIGDRSPASREEAH